MLVKYQNLLYLSALFLNLLLVSIPVLPSYLRYIAFCLFVIYMLVAGIRINKVYYRWTLAYFSFFLISALWALKVKFVFYVLIINLLPIFILAFATIIYVKNNQSMNSILLVIYVVALVMLSYFAINIDELLIGVRLGNSFNEDGELPTWNSNGIGIFLCFAIFSGFLLFISQQRHWLVRIAYCISAVIMFFAILLTGSRKSLLILFFPIFYFLYKRGRKYFFLIIILVPFICFLLYELIMNNEILYGAIGSRIEEMIDIIGGDTTGNEDTSRIELINFGIDKYWDNPILGVGINNFRALSEIIYPGKNFYAHNNYIELLVDVGIIGVIIYYSAYCYIFKRLHKCSDTLSIWGMAFLYILFFLGFFEVLYYEPLEQLVFCLLFCIVDFNNKNIRLLDGKEIKNS